MLPIRTKRLGQLTDEASSNMNDVTQQAQALMPGTGNPSQDLADMMDQQVASFQQAQDTVSKLWWQQNWPLVAVGVGALGVAGYLIFKKK